MRGGRCGHGCSSTTYNQDLPPPLLTHPPPTTGPPRPCPPHLLLAPQVMFAHLSLGRGSFYNPRSFWISFKDYDGSPIDIKEHQDAYEFFTRLQDCVDQHCRATGQQPTMQATMGGCFAQQIICKEVNYRYACVGGGVAVAAV